MTNELGGHAAVLTRCTTAADVAIAVALGQRGAQVHVLNPAPVDDLFARFADAQALPPMVHRAASVADLDGLYKTLSTDGSPCAIVGRVAPDHGAAGNLTDEAAFLDRLQVDAWHVVEHLQSARRCDVAPVVVLLTCAEPARRTEPAAAAAQSVAEVLARYLATHWLESGVRINTVRSSLLAADDSVDVTGLADAVAELCGPRLAAMSGQILCVDPEPRFAASRRVKEDDDNGWRGRAVLVTGGTGGIGLATAMAFAALGARAWITYRWGTHDEDDVRRMFADIGALEPRIVEADASNEDDTDELFRRIADAGDELRAFISNVTFARVGRLDESTPFRDLARGLRYSAWPLVTGVRASQRHLGRTPRYIVGVSSDGPDRYYPGYDFVAASKAALESLCRSLAAELAPAETRVNVLRAAPVQTDALEATFGQDFVPFCQRYDHRPFLVARSGVAQAAVSLCSGSLDALTGETLFLDNGIAFSDTVSRLFEERARYGLGGDRTS